MKLHMVSLLWKTDSTGTHCNNIENNVHILFTINRQNTSKIKEGIVDMVKDIPSDKMKINTESYQKSITNILRLTARVIIQNRYSVTSCTGLYTKIHQVVLRNCWKITDGLCVYLG